AAAWPPLWHGRPQGGSQLPARGSSGIGMIHYNLRCNKGHAFESWFQSSSAYESQEKRKLVSCPICGTTSVERAIMAPQVVGKKGREPPAEPSPVAAPSTEVAAPAPASLMMAQ